MANPRKFSEKIALHNQKQAEETAEFNRIMKEVSDATNKSPLSCIDDLEASAPGGPGNSPNRVDPQRERPRSAAVGPMRSRPSDKRMSPYSPSSGVYHLSPPPDTTWRRTHSDSALHTSSHESAHYRKTLECQSQMMMDEYDSGRRLSSASPDGRPRSVNDLPRVPGISIYPSQQDPGAIQIPISGNNTGSLPDLTCFHIPSPLNTPLDHDDQASHCGAYCGSPRSLSPTPHSPSGRFSYVGTPPNEAPGPPSPHTMNNSNHLFVPSYPSHKALHHSKERLQDSYSSSFLPPISSLHQTNQVPSSYGNTSPCGSSPQSPTSPTNVSRNMNSSAMNSSSDHNNYFIGQANALHHHFEQICMNEDNSQMRSHELTPDPGYYSTSPLQQSAYTRMTQDAASPNTPSSILPDIVLTDYSNSDELNISKEFCVNMSLDSDLFPSDECLREGLVPVDLDELQMLNNCPDMIADAATEDHLRLDRL
ncbi:CREB regulated transcription coactivator [Nesidiocoris tenuis]|uniref:CREB regulated transcription coactivator n=1 Tax=Nesidiocoris tenuis TaxID=355587 RepID=A0ABN7AGP6_9HEMI|nr:CREB regulated transcription coactivator [Nesidiocoris tenuis]